MKSWLIFALLILAASTSAPVQGQSLLTGQVLDDSTDQPLAYVRLSLTQAQRGTLSNEEGYFRLQLPANLEGDTLEVFVLGYAPQYLAISQLPARQLELRLTPRALELSAVTILSETPQGLLQRAIAQIPANYPTTDWLWEAFYREVEDWNFLRMEDRKDTLTPQRSISLGEALVDIFMPGYDRRGNPSVRLLQGRLIHPEEMIQDSLDPQVLAMVESFEKPGGPPGQATFDVARDPGEFAFLKKRGDKWYQYEMRGMLEYQGRPAYRIDFAQRPEEQSSNSLLDGSVYLDTATLAFVSVRFHLSEEAKLFSPEFSALGVRLKLTDLQGRIEYRLQQGHWVLAYNDLQRELYIGIPDGLVFRKNFKLESYLRTRLEVLITELKSDGATGIPRKEQFRNREALSEEVGRYDPDFWTGKAILPVDQRLLQE
jgi:hypothetical protein